MSALLVFPDIESILIKHLLTVSEVTTLVSNRVYAELVPDVVYPALTCRKISSRTGRPRWLEACTVEVASYTHRDVANARSSARLICETGVAALSALSNHVFTGCVIAGPLSVVGPRSIPMQIAPGVTNPRFTAEVALTYHP